jgi:hypothetical protein
MTTKALTRRQARWAETMGCFDFEIVFRPGRASLKPNVLSRRPDLAPAEGKKLTFGQLLRLENITEDTFAAIAEFDTHFEDETVEMDDADYWFDIDVVGVEQEDREVPQITQIAHDKELVQRIRELTSSDARLQKLLGSPSTTSTNRIVYNRGAMEVPANDGLKYDIVCSRHDCKLAGHLGRAKTLALVKRCFTWPLVKRFVNQYVDGCESCQQSKPSTSQPLGRSNLCQSQRAHGRT